MDPCHDAGSLPDLVGARILIPRATHLAGTDRGEGAPIALPLGTATRSRVAAMLPRLRRDELLDELGLSGDAASSIDEAPLDPTHRAGAAAASVGLAHLRARGQDEAAARLAAVHLAAGRVPVRELASALGVTPRAVFKLRVQLPLIALVRALALQLRMRAGRMLPADEGFALPCAAGDV